MAHREFLFRGKEEPFGNWAEGFLVDESHIGDWTQSQPVDPETVGQYTGLSDKAGREAFEHDIIKHHFGDEIGVIRYGKYANPFGDDSYGRHVGFHIDWVAGSCPDCLRKDLGYWMRVTEIIGNIHDNPELLEGQT